MYAAKARLDDRVAVITGGSRGIGFACADALSEFGATVVVADLDVAEAERALDPLRAKDRQAEAYACDITQSEDVNRLVETVLAAHGRIDILVASAGIARSGVPAEEVSDELWLNVNDVNYNGLFWCNRAFARPMLAARCGAIINIGSISGFIVNRPQKQSYYNASKAAVHHLTASLAAEWADRGIRVNAVAPTYIATAMTTFAAEQGGMMDAWLRDTPMGRMGTPEEIASVVHFLASDASSLMTGTTVLADGGFVCW